MRNFANKVQAYFPFNASEIKAITLTIIILTFIVAFNDDSETFNLASWISNFILWLIIVAIAVIVKQIGHRLVGIFYGFRVEYKLWWYGIIIALAIAFVSRGHIWLLIPGGIWIHHLAFHRVGWFRYGTNMRAFSMISLAGPAALIIFATFIKTLQIWFHLFPQDSILVQNIFVFNLWFAACSLFPIPPLDGSRIMFDSRLVYIFIVSAVVAYSFLVWIGIFSYVYALLFAVVAWFLWWLQVER